MEVPPQVVPLKLAYKKAEDALHSLGIDGSGADIASVNELRYAGNHLLQALTASDQRKRRRSVAARAASLRARSVRRL